MGAELFHAAGRTDGQTERQIDITKVIAPENCFVIEDDYSCKKKRLKFSVKYVQMSDSVSNKISVYTLQKRTELQSVDLETFR